MNKLNRPIADLKNKDSGGFSYGGFTNVAKDMMSVLYATEEKIQKLQEEHLDSLKAQDKQRNKNHREILRVIVAATRKKAKAQKKLERDAQKAERQKQRQQEKEAKKETQDTQQAKKDEKVEAKKESESKKQEVETKKTEKKSETETKKAETKKETTDKKVEKKETEAQQTKKQETTQQKQEQRKTEDTVKREETKPKPTAKPVEEVKPPPTAKPEAAPPAAPTISKLPKGMGPSGIFSNANDFASTMAPYAKRASEKLGGKVPFMGILGQWAGESASGKSLPSDFNYAGIKAGKTFQKGDFVLTEEFYTDAQLQKAKAAGESFERELKPGDKIRKGGKDVDAWDFYKGPGKGATAYQQSLSEGKHLVQVKSYFAKFNSIDDFVDAYVKFVSNPRYKKALEASTPQEFGTEIAKAGYATNSAETYGKKISTFAATYGDTIGSMSSDNTNMRKDMQRDSGTTIIVQENNNTTVNKRPMVMQEKRQELNPTMR